MRKYHVVVPAAAILLSGGIYLAARSVTRSGDGIEGVDTYEHHIESGIDAATTPVAAAVAVTRSMGEELNVHGFAVAYRDVEVYAKTSGIVDTLMVSEGQQVDRGDTLCRLDASELLVGLREAETAYRLALEEYKAMRIADSLVQARETTIAPSEHRDDIIRAKSGLSNAEHTLQRARLSHAATVIRSPIRGEVARMSLQRGQRIAAGERVCRVIDDDRLHIQVGLLEEEVTKVRVGQTVMVTLASLERKVLTGKVVSVCPTRSAEENTFPVTVEVRNDGNVLSGMHARVSIMVGERRKGLCVPRDAVIERFGRPAVLKIVGSNALLAYVTTGLSGPTHTEILNGLSDGDTVVAEGGVALGHGANVLIIPEQEIN